MNTDPLKNPEEGVQNSFKWQGKDGRGGQIISAAFAAGRSVLGVFQFHH